MISLTLYTTLGCHLCAQVEMLLGKLANQPIEIKRIEIIEDERLVERYGSLIPVVMDSQGGELIKSFEIERLAHWLRARGWLDEGALDALVAMNETPPKSAYRQNGRRFLG
ncbi:glutaredoxin family protein [Vreelandella populi]|uniref:Glutaredoxin family protein n=1 Tax=Vreelandella populi TaxID=2498858 RepID=A0A433LGJ3_9GAMM|nr:glutaredoxin family protein [Halomonas populi]RUR38019.1 glutaredoxin family protein [Halomonas populi]RUR48997.1 glutaredoxin family protein [Halomonas populi]RUR55340.1 glutaredoxin family protein [Halomonas populi]